MSGVAPASDRRVWVIAAVALTLLPLVAVSPLRDAMVELLAWLRTAGLSGVLVFSAAYVIATLLALPAALPTAAAGFVYGPWLGLLLVSPVSVLAATLAFGVSRWLVRDRVAAIVARDARWAAIESAVGERAWLVVFLLRLSPVVPFNLLNYALGVAPVRACDYVTASWIGMLPGTWLYVYAGSLAHDAAQLTAGELDMPLSAKWLYWVGMAATVVATVWLGRRARRLLTQALEQAESLRDAPTGIGVQ